MNPLSSQGTTRVPGSAAEAVFDGGSSLGTLIRILADDVLIDGIEVRNGTGDLIESVTGTPTRGIRLRNCIIHDSSGDEGVQLRAVAEAVLECNFVYSTVGDALSPCCGSTDGIIVAWAVSNVAVTDNYVHDNALNPGKWGNPAGILVGAEPDAATITVAGNRVVNNTPNGLTNKAASLLVAENNWWGSASGPGPVGPGTGDQVSTNVDYDPWLSGPASPSCPPIGTCPGGNPTPVPSMTWGRIKALFR